MDHPGLARFIAQAAIGYIGANFVLIVARILLVPDYTNDWFVFWLPPVFVGGLVVGTVVGALIWLWDESIGEVPNMFVRSIIGVATVALLLFVVVWSFSDRLVPTGEELWLLELVIVPGIATGVVTNSSLRLWHELVRQGEAVRKLPKILAGFTGLVLRPLVVFSFMCCLIVMIARLQLAYDWGGRSWVWTALLCGHFAAGVAVLFARLKTSLLFPLALIANAPIIAALVQFHVSRPDVPYVAIPYLGVWAVFLLMRWRQTDLALSFLNEEIHYYLID